ncbi:MAG: hypothetical protein LUG91_03680 [Ruminococcus sp.]|nr:hypothetical protein [Ruminococcus sp.]
MSENNMNENNNKSGGLAAIAAAGGAYLINHADKVVEFAKKIFPCVRDLIRDAAAKLKYNEYRLNRNIDVQYLKYYRDDEKNSVIVIAKMSDIIECNPEAMSQLEPKEIEAMNNFADEYILAEYNKITGNLNKTHFITKEQIASNVMTAINANDGVLVIE